MVNVFLWGLYFCPPPPALLVPCFSFWEVMRIRGTDRHPHHGDYRPLGRFSWLSETHACSHIRGSATEVEGPRYITGLTTEERVKFEEMGLGKFPPRPPQCRTEQNLKKKQKKWPRWGGDYDATFFVVVELLERICLLT